MPLESRGPSLISQRLDWRRSCYAVSCSCLGAQSWLGPAERKHGDLMCYREIHPCVSRSPARAVLLAADVAPLSPALGTVEVVQKMKIVASPMLLASQICRCRLEHNSRMYCFWISCYTSKFPCLVEVPQLHLQSCSISGHSVNFVVCVPFEVLVKSSLSAHERLNQ